MLVCIQRLVDDDLIAWSIFLESFCIPRLAVGQALILNKAWLQDSFKPERLFKIRNSIPLVKKPNSAAEVDLKSGSCSRNLKNSKAELASQENELSMMSS